MATNSETVNLTYKEIEILIAESATNSYRMHVMRAKRIFDRAAADYHESQQVLQNMEVKLNMMRETYLKGAV